MAHRDISRQRNGLAASGANSYDFFQPCNLGGRLARGASGDHSMGRWPWVHSNEVQRLVH